MDERLLSQEMMLKIVSTFPYFMRKLVHSFPKIEKASGLNKTQHRTLWLLFHEGRQCMSCLADHLNIEKGSFTTVIDSLIEKGLVKKIHDSSDRRRIFIDFTPKGRSHVQTEIAQVHERISQKLSVLSDAEYAVFLQAINDLHNTMMKL